MTTTPKLPKKAQWLADRFTENANWGDLHRLDWLRFYDFVVHCARHCRHLRQHDVAEYFEAIGMPRHVVLKLSEAFHHGTYVLLRARYCRAPESPWAEKARTERSSRRAREA